MKKLLGLLLCSAGVLSSQAVTYNGHTYELLDRANWANAEAAAVALGGHLVTINDAAEESFLRTTFGTDLFWIGFTDQAVEGTWQWISGEAVTYQNWNGGEPNNLGDEDYAVLNWNSTTGGWNDWGGQNIIRAIAEIPNGATGVPDGGATAALLGLGVAAVACVRRKVRA